MSNLRQFEGQKHLNLETFKKNGESVKTPVWYVISDGLIYVITRELTGKVKRLKNNPKVNVVPCAFRGVPKGEWVKGTTNFLDGDEIKKILKLRKKKYGIMSSLAGMLSSSKGDYVGFSIKISDSKNSD